MKQTILFPLLCALALPSAWAVADVKYGVICYHDVIDQSKPSFATNMSQDVRRTYFPQTITVERLITHFNWLRDNGYTPVSWQQIKAARAGKGSLPAKPVLLTFDDGYVSFYTTIYPILQAYNYPAVYGLVTSWLETPADGHINYGGIKLPRSAFITWEQVREMQQSGLIEMASHTHDMHHGQTGNPGGSQFAAVFPGNYRNKGYETPSEYRARIRDDLKKSRDIIKQRTGVTPDVLVWPYGQFTQTAVEIARELGFHDDMTLKDEKLSTIGEQSIGRSLVDQESSLSHLKSYLEDKYFVLPNERAVYVKLDDLYNADPVKQNQNYDKLIHRMWALGTKTVYLQAVSDENGDGAADSAYFPNRHLKMKADLFSQVSWQLNTRANVEVKAWMPMLAFDLGDSYEYLTDSRTGRLNAHAVKRLSPYNAKNRQAVKEIYEDLAFNSRFKGLAFGDDGFITEFEAANQGNDAAKTDALIAYSDILKNAALQYSFNGVNEMKTARSIWAEAAMPSEKPVWLGQNLAKFARHYNHTVVHAAPYSLTTEWRGGVSEAWLGNLLAGLRATDLPHDKIVFNIPNRAYDGQQLISSQDLAARIMQVRKARFKGAAFSDDFVQNQPDLKTVKPVFGIK